MSESTKWVCPHCNAKQLGPSADCWLCNKPLTGEPASAGGGASLDHPPAEAGSPDMNPDRFSFSLATLFLLITLASVCMGLLVALPGLGIFACLVMGPVFFRTIRVVRHREAVGREVSSAEKVSLFFGSFVVSSILVIVVCASAFCSFCGVCLTVVSISGETEWLPMGLGISALAIGGIVVAVKRFKWNRRRFRRDMDEE